MRERLGRATASTTLYRDGHLLNDNLSGVAVAFGNAITTTAVSGGVRMKTNRVEHLLSSNSLIAQLAEATDLKS